MSKVRSKNTSPEIFIAKIVKKFGVRFKKHDDKLPGKPDLAFPTLKKVIFVDGCFWHGHNCKRGKRVPKTNTDYWLGKIKSNRHRDFKARALLKKNGWAVLRLWECQLKNKALLGKLNLFFS